MKKVLLTLSLCLSFTAASAQLLNVASVKKIDITSSQDRVVAGISQQGDFLLLTNAQNNGLSKYQLTTGATTAITNAPGAGYQPQISADGKQVVFRETSVKNHLRSSKVNKVNLETGQVTALTGSLRNIQAVAINGDAAITVNKGKVSTKSLGTAKASVQAPVLSINNRALMITQNGRTKVFSPNGTQFSYIWPSLSPDQTKVLYYVCGRGAYVADLNGNIIANLGIIRAPKWYGDNMVVGMRDQDNGEVTTQSVIVAADLNGNEQVLTDNSVIAMYPQVAPQAGKIAFSTPAGEAYIIDINSK
ncbi:MAG: hypothetical protein ACI308_08310 [Muribaculaceae bacterium]